MFLKTFKFILFVLFIVFTWQYGRTLALDMAWYEAYFKSIPLFLSGFLFIIFYVAITFFAWLAKDFFKILGAIAFGAYLSTLLIWVAEMISAAFLFYVSRTLGRDFVEKHILKGKLKKADDRMARIGAVELFALRAFPLIPMRFLDATAGLTKIPFRFYFLFVVVASPVRIFWVQFILAGAGKAFLNEPTALVSYLNEHTTVFIVSLIYLVAALAAIIFFNRKRQ